MYDRRKVTVHPASLPPVEAITQAIALLDYVPNAVASWVDAHAGNKALANVNGKKIEKIVDGLSEILMTMPKSVSYEVYGLTDTLKFKDAESLIEGLKQRGIRHTGYDTLSTSFRPEIRGQPTFDNLAGPMYGGAGKVRYETWELSDLLSK